MDNPALLVKNKFRRLDMIFLLLPPCANAVALLAGDAVSHRKGQSGSHFRDSLRALAGARNNAHTQLFERFKTFSVAV